LKAAVVDIASAVDCRQLVALDAAGEFNRRVEGDTGLGFDATRFRAGFVPDSDRDAAHRFCAELRVDFRVEASPVPESRSTRAGFNKPVSS